MLAFGTQKICIVAGYFKGFTSLLQSLIIVLLWIRHLLKPIPHFTSMNSCFESLWTRCRGQHDYKPRSVYLARSTGPTDQKFPANIIRNQKYSIITFIPMVCTIYIWLYHIKRTLKSLPVGGDFSVLFLCRIYFAEFFLKQNLINKIKF